MAGFGRPAWPTIAKLHPGGRSVTARAGRLGGEFRLNERRLCRLLRSSLLADSPRRTPQRYRLPVRRRGSGVWAGVQNVLTVPGLTMHRAVVIVSLLSLLRLGAGVVRLLA